MLTHMFFHNNTVHRKREKLYQFEMFADTSFLTRSFIHGLLVQIVFAWDETSSWYFFLPTSPALIY